MFSTTIISKIAYLMISFIFGLLFFYVTSEANKHEKKQQMDMIFSLLINFIIYMWIGKVILNFTLMFKDPIAVLAYPMNSYTFYIGIVFIVVNLIYLKVRKDQNLTVIFHTFLPIFLASLFIYEFIELVIENNSQQLLSFILQLILLFSYLFWGNKQAFMKEVIFILWIVGKLILSIILPYTKIFNFLIPTYFYVVLFIVFMIIHMYHRKRKVA